MDKAKKSKVYEWIEDAEKLVTPKVVRPKKTYDEKLVAFIDILGMSDKVRDKKNDAEQILTMMGSLRTCVGSECESLLNSRKLTFLQLGDGFTIVAELDCVDKLCEALSNIQWRVLIYHQMLLRGALTAGRIGIDEDMKYIVGPAFLEAFTLESQNAIYPRIIFADEITEHMRGKSITFKHIAEDDDKLRYLDFIGHNIESKGLDAVPLDHLLTTRGIKGTLKTEYETYLSKNRIVAQKYGWLISKLASHQVSIM